MVRFKLSAFSDEYSPNLDSQIEGLLKNKVKMTELRNIDGVNVSDLSPMQAMDVKKKLELLEEKRAEMEFCSVEQIKKECKLSQSVLDCMRELGCLGDLPEKAQLSFFDTLNL